MKFLLIIAALTFTSCVTQLPQPQPQPKAAKELVKSYFNEKLKDENSARYKWYSPPFLAGTGRGKQWVMRFDMSKRNRFSNRYAGYKPYLAFFADGKIDPQLKVQSHQQNPYLSLIKPVKE